MECQSKQKFVSSPGKVIGSTYFEQTREGQYLVYDLVERKFVIPMEADQVWIQWVTEACTYVPLPKLPWPPITIPKSYMTVEVLYNEIKQFLLDHIDFAEKIEYEIATAWVMHTWRMENWKCTPYLFFFGPPASGKTWAMEVLGALAYRPMMTFPSPAAVYRTTEEWHPTFFLDEVQMYLQRTEKADIINYLNAGYRRGQTVIRMEENPQTKRLEPVPFEVFGPKCLAGTIGLLETLKTRCFTIVMSRAVRHVNLHLDAEQIDYFRSRLFTYRLDCLSENSDIIDMLQFSEKYKEITDGRLKELVFPLYEVAPTSCKELFAELLFKLRGELLEEEALSIEAIIFSALVTAHKERPLIPLSDVATAVNELITSTAEWIDNKTIGHIISKLGFNKMRYKNRTHIIWDDNIAVRLLKRYPTRREEE